MGVSNLSLRFILFLSVLSFFPQVHAGDEGFRFKEGVCQNKAGATGYNPEYWGQCGLWNEKDISDRRIRGLDLRGSSFRNAQITGTRFRNIKLDHATFVGALIEQTQFIRTSCRNCSFVRATFSGSIRSSDFSSSDLSMAEVLDSRILATRLNHLKANKLQMTRLELEKVSAKESDFSESQWTDVTWHGGVLSSANLRRSVFSSVSLRLMASKSDWRESKVTDLSTTFSSLKGARLDRGFWQNSSLSTTNLDDASLIGFSFTGGSFDHVSIKNVKYSLATKIPVSWEELEKQSSRLWTPQISAGFFSTCTQSHFGQLWCFGKGDQGQLGVGNKDDQLRPVLTVGLDVETSQVAVGTYHSCVLLDSGKVYCTGFDLFGQSGGHSSIGTVLTFTPLKEQTIDFKLIQSGFFHTCGISLDDKLYCFGRASFASGLEESTAVPTQITAIPGDIAHVSTTTRHTCAVTKEGKLYCFGVNYTGQLGREGAESREPNLVDVPEPVASVATGFGHTCAVTQSHRVYCFGDGAMGQLGYGELASSTSPVLVTANGFEFTKVSAGGAHTCGLTKNHKLYCWGSNASGQLAQERLGAWPTPVLVAGLEIADFTVGILHTCVLTTDGTTYCFGGGKAGQLGSGMLENSSQPIKIPLGQ